MMTLPFFFQNKIVMHKVALASEYLIEYQNSQTQNVPDGGVLTVASR